MVFIYYTTFFQDPTTGEYPLYYFIIYLLFMSLSSIIELTMFISSMSFNAKIADEVIGGTYMTFLATLSNLGINNFNNFLNILFLIKYFLTLLGGTYPHTVALYLVDLFSVKYCSDEPFQQFTASTASNSSSFLTNLPTISLNQTVIDLIQKNTCSSKKSTTVCVDLKLLFI